jgi:hypothetical protein
MNYKLANIQKIVILREHEKWSGNETALCGQDQYRPTGSEKQGFGRKWNKSVDMQDSAVKCGFC